jgi:hypothetical protein
MVGKKRKRKVKAQPERTFEQIALAEFRDTGEVTGLLVLADYLDERDEQPEFAAKLREVAQSPDAEWFWNAIRFFIRTSGQCEWDGVSAERRQWNAGVSLAEAESWFQKMEDDDRDDSGRDRDRFPAVGALRISWEIDDVYDRNDYDVGDMPPIAWVCGLEIFSGYAWFWEESLGAITFSGDGELDGTQADRDYRRVVEAELAAELKARTK